MRFLIILALSRIVVGERFGVRTACATPCKKSAEKETMVRSRGGDQGSNASIDQEDVDLHAFMLLNANKRSMALSAVLPSRARPLAAVRVTLEPKGLTWQWPIIDHHTL